MSAEELTEEERRAIASLKRLAKRWPRSLSLLSYDGSLAVVHTADCERIFTGTPASDPDRQDLILADIDGIPNDGGGW